MLLKEFRDYSKSKYGSKKIKLEYDRCKLVFERNGTTKKGIHFCSKICVDNSSKLGEILHTIKVNSCPLRFGATSAMQSERVREKLFKENLKKYGVEFTLQNGILRDKTGYSKSYKKQHQINQNNR